MQGGPEAWRVVKGSKTSRSGELACPRTELAADARQPDNAERSQHPHDVLCYRLLFDSPCGSRIAEGGKTPREDSKIRKPRPAKHEKGLAAPQDNLADLGDAAWPPSLRVALGEEPKRP